MIKTFIIMSLLAVPCFGQDVPDDRMQRIYETTVRVLANGSIGTGSIFHKDDKYYYILTNDHVVGDNSHVNIEYTRNHVKSSRIRAEVIGSKHTKGLTIDVAILRISKSSLNNIDLPVMPIGETAPNMNDKLLITCGCQNGARPSIQQCYMVQRVNNLIKYTPTSLPGRSGSMLCDVEGKEILGLVAWMSGGENSVGIAMTCSSIRDFCYGVVQASSGNDPIAVRALENSDIEGVVPLPIGAFEIPPAREEDAIPTAGDSN